tara:strand:+ start:1399 stop:2523 length:1125 start_codon:yes stop_codon:yes gene_type:complete
MEQNRPIHNLYYEWWKNIDKFIFFLIILLFITGLFFSLVSTSLLVSDKLDTNDYTFFLKHLSFVFLGLLIIFILSSIKEEKLFKISPVIFLLSLISLFLVPVIGIEVNNAQRWLDFYFLPRFQPIEIVKPFLIILICIILSSEKNKNVLIKYVISFFITFVIALLLAAQPDIGQTLLIFFTWSVLIFISGINVILLIISCLILLIALYFSINFIPKFAYIKNRILSFFNTETGSHNAQSEKAIDSITSGGYFGKGIGEGTLKNRVPEAHTDYIISVISEEFGVIAIILIILMFLIFIYSVFKKVNLENEERTKLVLVGCVSLILVQAMIHIGVNIRLFPTTGMTLPFISYGGSSIISTSILSGIILNLTKRKIN